MASDGTGGLDLLKTEEAAVLLDLAPRTLEGLRVRGGGPPFVRLGKGRRCKVRYRLGDLIEWLEGNTFDSTSSPRRVA